MTRKTKRTLFFFLAAPALSLALTGASREPLWRHVLAGACAGSPAVADGKAIVATRSGELVALDAKGRLAWKQKLPGGCVAAPAVDALGDIYVACADGTLLRYTLSGMELWRVSLGQELLATPLPGKEDLYVAGGQGRVFQVAKKDGSVRRRAELGLPVHSSPIWADGRELLLVPAKDYHLIALDTELAVRWKFKAHGVLLSSPAVSPSGDVYLASMGRRLYKLNSGGRPLWEYATQGWIRSSPVLDEKGRAYFGSYDRHVHAVSTDGKPLWRFQGKAQFAAGAVLDAAGNLYCGDTSGTVYALSSAGRQIWDYKNDDFITSDLTILPEKVLLAGSIDGTLLAFRIERPMSKKAWWAKYLGNLANSGFDEN